MFYLEIFGVNHFTASGHKIKRLHAKLFVISSLSLIIIFPLVCLFSGILENCFFHFLFSISFPLQPFLIEGVLG